MVSLSLQCTPHVLKIYLFELPDNKNTGTFFSKYELLFPNQANSSFAPSQILILQHPIPISSLHPSPFLADFVPLNSLKLVFLNTRAKWPPRHLDRVYKQRYSLIHSSNYIFHRHLSIFLSLLVNTIFPVIFTLRTIDLNLLNLFI